MNTYFLEIIHLQSGSEKRKSNTKIEGNPIKEGRYRLKTLLLVVKTFLHFNQTSISYVFSLNLLKFNGDEHNPMYQHMSSKNVLNVTTNKCINYRNSEIVNKETG